MPLKKVTGKLLTVNKECDWETCILQICDRRGTLQTLIPFLFLWRLAVWTQFTLYFTKGKGLAIWIILCRSPREFRHLFNFSDITGCFEAGLWGWTLSQTTLTNKKYGSVHIKSRAEELMMNKQILRESSSQSRQIYPDGFCFSITSYWTNSPKMYLEESKQLSFINQIASMKQNKGSREDDSGNW